MQMTFEAVAEAKPGTKWQAGFHKNWPDYKAWFLSRGGHRGPSLGKSVQQLRRFMPELLPTYERLVELAGGDELAARFLSCYQPPAYLSGCSQAVWLGPEEPILIRNYDLDPRLCEGLIFSSAWHGRKVIATNECLWGVDDGINDAGLALSLAFGGRKVVGKGFGIPLILRYILEFCDTTAEAIEVLRRVPSHMAYNVTVLDRQGNYATVMVAPDRPTQVTHAPVATNHQGAVENPEHARFTRTLERERFLTERLGDDRLNEQALIANFLRAPLYNTAYRSGFGTLYTAIYRTEQGQAEFRWPDSTWVQSFANFQEGERSIRFHQTRKTTARQHTDTATDWTDTAWAASDTSLSGIFEQTVTAVLNGLRSAGVAIPGGFIDECRKELQHTGQLPWHKLGSLWSGGGDTAWTYTTDASAELRHSTRCWRRHSNKDGSAHCERER